MVQPKPRLALEGSNAAYDGSGRVAQLPDMMQTIPMTPEGWAEVGQAKPTVE